METKFIRNALLITTLLALQAAAQPAPPSARPIPTPQTAQPGQPSPLNPPMGFGGPVVMPEKDKMSYAIGMYYGSSIKNQQLDVDLDILIGALKDVLAGRTNHMSEDEMKSTLRQLTTANRVKMQNIQREKMAREAVENKNKGDEYLAKNSKLDGVKVLPDGLQYKVIREGTGVTPKTNDTVTLTYRGTLTDGTLFDARTNSPAQVTGSRTIKGWTEVLPMMKIGAEWQIVVPSDLAYGVQGRGPKVGPSAVLIYDLELVGIGPSAAPAAALSTSNAAAKGAPFSPTSVSVPPPPVASGSPVVSGQIIRVPSAEDLKKGAKIEVITNAPGQ